MALTDYIITGYKNIDNVNETGNITISDSEGILCFSLDNNDVYISYGDTSWIKIEDLSNLNKTQIKIYFEQNLLSSIRNTYINFINKKTGYIDTFFIEQEACFYDIKIEKENYSFINKETPISIVFQVYGNTKKCKITNEHFFIKKENEKYYPFDKGLGFKLIKIKNDENNQYIKYSLDIEYIGNISNLSEEDMYCVVLQHNDNKDTKKYININISAIISEENNNKEEKIQEILKDIPNGISDFEYDNNKARTDTVEGVNYVLNFKKPNKIIAKVNDDIESLILDRIEDGIIYVKSNTYNRNGKLEHNSMVLGSSSSTWCSVDDRYDKENELHEIIVKCTPNKSGNNRKSFLVLTNTENLRNIKKFLILQDKEGNITIENKS